MDVNPYPEGYTPPSARKNDWGKRGERDQQLEIGYQDTRQGWEDSRAEGEGERSCSTAGRPGKMSSMSMLRQLSSHFMNKVEIAISSPTKLQRARSIASPDPRQDYPSDVMVRRDLSALSNRLLSDEDELEGDPGDPGLPRNPPPRIQISCPLSPKCQVPALGSVEGKERHSPIVIH